jgi:hypothetical protein
MHQVIVILIIQIVIQWKQALAFISPSLVLNQHNHLKNRPFIPMSHRKTLSHNDNVDCDHNDISVKDRMEVVFSYLVHQILNDTWKEKEDAFEYVRVTASNSLLQLNALIVNKLHIESKQAVFDTHTIHSNEPLFQMVLHTTYNLRQLMHYYGPSRGQGRKTLIELIQVSKLTSPSNALVVILMTCALALNVRKNHDDDDDMDRMIAISRAIVSGILPQGRYSNDKKSTKDMIHTDDHSYPSMVSTVALNTVHSLLNMTLEEQDVNQGVSIDLHVITSLARSFVNDTKPLSSICTSVIRCKLNLEQDNICLYDSNVFQDDKNKADIIGALGLAAQLAPWSDISPIPLVEVAITNNLWHAAERLCDSAILFKSSDTHEVVQTLIDGASDRHLYRVMDTYATTYYDHGGYVQFAEARFMHACDTIAKVISKRQYPIIEKQVERVDMAFIKVKTEHIMLDLDRDGPREVREFTLEKLMETNEHDAAHRFATLWGYDFIYNEQDAEKYAKARREKYLQFNHAFPNSSEDIPVPISCPNLLSKSLSDLKSSIQSCSPVIGFDVEWGEEKGASLLQLSTMSNALLIDIPALLETEQGCDALDLVGQLFQEKKSILMLGFSCGEDISRLKSSVGVRARPWITSTTAVVDLKPLITLDNPKLKHVGLSKLCDVYCGKPLDKSEQCSLWARRPLTKLQCTYAALDAWAVVAIWSKLRSEITEALLPNRNTKQCDNSAMRM